MKSYIVMWTLLVPSLIQAQHSNVARFELLEVGKKDYLVVHFSSLALQEIFGGELVFEGESTKTELTALKLKAINYLKSTIDIRMNGEKLTLGPGTINLTQKPHVRLEVQNLPDKIHSWHAHISSFQEIGMQQSLFILNARNKPYKALLQANNDFTFSYQENYYLQQARRNIRFLLVWVVIIMSSVLLSSGFAFLNKQHSLRKQKTVI